MTHHGLPRTRGDGPVEMIDWAIIEVASPHTRGWTLRRGVRPRRHWGFPAHAGMDPGRAPLLRRWRRLPRTRGDGPRGEATHACPPCWLPRTRGDGPLVAVYRIHFAKASPHTRGWTRFNLEHARAPAGFPAHAGMDPCRRSRRGLSCRLPRTRGDGPPPAAVVWTASRASPHTRGWTRLVQQQRVDDVGFPAHAGMDPPPGPRPGRGGGLPRTRGDGPDPGTFVRDRFAASPHTRGWTAVRGRGLRRDAGFPAHAGMDPR